MLGAPDVRVVLEARLYKLENRYPIFFAVDVEDRKSTRLNSSHLVISYAVFCLKKKKNNIAIRYVINASHNTKDLDNIKLSKRMRSTSRARTRLYPNTIASVSLLRITYVALHD